MYILRYFSKNLFEIFGKMNNYLKLKIFSTRNSILNHFGYKMLFTDLTIIIYNIDYWLYGFKMNSSFC